MRQNKAGVAPYWSNYRLVKAVDWRTAFQRASQMGREEAEMPPAVFVTEFVGISDLVPIYDAFEDGAEMLWMEHWPEDEDVDELPETVFTEEEMAEKYSSDRTVSGPIEPPQA